MKKATDGGKDGGPGPPREPIGQMAVRPFGKYFLVRKLAEGGMAEIFLAKQVGVEGFEKNVVIKRMLAAPVERARLRRACSSTRRGSRRGSSHPNIVQIYDLGHADGCYYIAWSTSPARTSRRCCAPRRAAASTCR